MLFVVTLSHDPDDCWAREENEATARNWIAGLDGRAEEHGVELHGTYITPNEHTFYIVAEADAFEDVTRFLGPPLLTDHDAHVAPVLPLEDGISTALED